MPFFQTTLALDGDLEKATSELNTSEDWQVIISICDKIKSTPNGPKEGLRAIMKRISHRVPHVSMQALTVLAACVNNCGKPFHLEICSRDWITEARAIIFKSHPKVSDKLKELIEQWAEDFKNDAQLNLLPQFYRKLKSDGVSFPSKSEPDVNKKSKNDEIEFKEDLDLAIALSLQDSGPATKEPSQNYYPSYNLGASTTTPQAEPKKVRALYDFEAAEDNELSFKTGEIILVSDDSDQNWWKGENARGVGLFPANFVTTDLSQPPPEEPKKEKKKVRFSDENGNEAKQTKATKAKASINEQNLDICLAMLKNASPTEEDDEEEKIRDLEDFCSQMSPLIQKKIEDSEQKRTHLEELNQQFIQAITLYQQSMKEPVPVTPVPVYSSSQQHYQQIGASQVYSTPAYQPQQQMYVGAQTPSLNMQPPAQYLPVSSNMMQAQEMQAVYSNQGPSSISSQQQYSQYTQSAQNTGYQNATYYTSNEPAAVQRAYAPAQPGMGYDYGISNPQQQNGQMYSQATVYQ